MKLEPKDIRIDTYRNSRTVHMTLVHMPTGIRVNGGPEKSQYLLQKRLMKELEDKVKEK